MVILSLENSYMPGGGGAIGFGGWLSALININIFQVGIGSLVMEWMMGGEERF